MRCRCSHDPSITLAASPAIGPRRCRQPHRDPPGRSQIREVIQSPRTVARRAYRGCSARKPAHSCGPCDGRAGQTEHATNITLPISRRKANASSGSSCSTGVTDARCFVPLLVKTPSPPLSAQPRLFPFFLPAQPHIPAQRRPTSLLHETFFSTSPLLLPSHKDTLKALKAAHLATTRIILLHDPTLSPAFRQCPLVCLLFTRLIRV